MHTAVAVGCHSQRLDMPFIQSPIALPKEVTLSLPPHSSSQCKQWMFLPSHLEALQTNRHSTSTMGVNLVRASWGLPVWASPPINQMGGKDFQFGCCDEQLWGVNVSAGTAGAERGCVTRSWDGQSVSDSYVKGATELCLYNFQALKQKYYSKTSLSHH